MTRSRRAGIRAVLGLLIAAILVTGCAGLAPSAPAATTLTIQASAPTVSCDQPGTWTITDTAGSEVPIPITLTCDKAVAAAWARLGSDSAIASIEFHYNDYCPPGWRCGPPTDPDRGHVVFHPADGRPDMLLPVQSDQAGNVVAEGPGPMPTQSGG